MSVRLSKRRLAEFSGKLFRIVGPEYFYPLDVSLAKEFNEMYGENLTSKTLSNYVRSSFKRRPFTHNILSRKRHSGKFFYKFKSSQIQTLIDLNYKNDTSATPSLILSAFKDAYSGISDVVDAKSHLTSSPSGVGEGKARRDDKVSIEAFALRVLPLITSDVMPPGDIKKLFDVSLKGWRGDQDPASPLKEKGERICHAKSLEDSTFRDYLGKAYKRGLLKGIKRVKRYRGIYCYCRVTPLPDTSSVSSSSSEEGVNVSSGLEKDGDTSTVSDKTIKATYEQDSSSGVSSCLSCGGHNNIRAHFCQWCGTSLSRTIGITIESSSLQLKVPSRLQSKEEVSQYIFDTINYELVLDLKNNEALLGIGEKNEKTVG